MPEAAIVEVHDVRHNYRGVLALDGVSLAIAPGSFAAVLGPNGAGKSTLAQVLAGLLEPAHGEVRYAGVAARRDASMVRHGICLVPEGRRLFDDLTIEENLVVAGFGAGLKSKDRGERVRRASEMLPAALCEGMSTRLASTLSGGERQMVALARALICEPRLIILDEPSMGLAPLLVDQVYDILANLRRRGVAVVVVEQIATHALEHADTIYLLSRGHIVYSGPPSDEASREAIRSSYVGDVQEHVAADAPR